MKTLRFRLLAIFSILFQANTLDAQWMQTNGPYGGNVTAYAFAVSGTNLFAGTSGGVFLSTNNGVSWTAVNSGLTNTNVMVLAVNGTNLFAGTWGGGVFLSANNGTSWTAASTGLTNLNVQALAVNGTNLFVGTSGGGVFLSTNNGTNWTAFWFDVHGRPRSCRQRHQSFRRNLGWGLSFHQQRCKLDCGQCRLGEP